MKRFLRAFSTFDRRETLLRASGLRILDAHHHLWDLSTRHYPWLSDDVRAVSYGDYSAIRRSYLPAEFRSDISSLPVIKTVHVEAGIAVAEAVSETRWVQEVAEASGAEGLARAIVAFVDLSRDDAPAVLAEHCRFPNVRGVRQMLHAGPAAAYLQDPRWRANLARLADHGLSFDLQILPRQMSDAMLVIQRNPRIQFVLDHAGCPVRDGEGWRERWMEATRQLATMPNVFLKLSGFGMFDRDWTTATIRPLAETAIDVFGVDRCMFGSNFPVDSLMASYGEIWSSYLSIVSGLGGVDQDKLLCGNAERVYRI